MAIPTAAADTPTITDTTVQFRFLPLEGTATSSTASGANSTVSGSDTGSISVVSDSDSVGFVSGSGSPQSMVLCRSSFSMDALLFLPVL